MTWDLGVQHDSKILLQTSGTGSSLQNMENDLYIDVCSWPACSPYLNALDIYQLGHLKQLVYYDFSDEGI